MSAILANNAASTLAAAITDTDTTIALAPGTGALFPSPTGGDWFPLTLVAEDGSLEIVHCTARATDSLTVTRGQEGTAAQAFNAGNTAELRVTAEVFTDKLPVGSIATLFVKGDGGRAAWEVYTATTLQTASTITAVVGEVVVTVPSATSVTLPALTNGTDYFVYLASDGTLQAVDADVAAPAGERLVGGFHVYAGTGGISPYSCWDLNWRPKSNPRAMVIDPGKNVWGDIYLTDVEYTNYGYSRPGQTIADDGDRPILPAAVGGDGTALCPSASWWQFLDIFYAAGKRFGIYEELVSLAYGVVERQSVGTDPVTTQHQAGHRSACGCEQITGAMWQWFGGASATGGSGWSSIAEGRGNVFASNLTVPRFGASWGNGPDAGSRASLWDNLPSYSSIYVSTRGISDHLNLQAER